ncbi:ArsR family transcriptional regulator [Streptomyces rubellomurinus subsp. indigoferus]|uniref:ArsR family transcriptional regulator n=1 Tax=Streptomyces rubellomurinus (strain ATCC 31215) TaxID=359131 RepID=A0A0F2TEH7_STRR3|nr:metalloregulator ArsR/SmtB family transcription factor [Streptomyces rubellomurinus]KJS55586.1 ArsR family transcriptional regulator [Streptomyces rubellomurinus subsp. indigoferus]KJS60720.1 ArsR family transcriptional regulator [Streptomyces rubellomurinus]
MTDTDPVLRALAHPLRLRMLSLVWPGPMSAAELARELGVSHALASQHLRRLDAVGLVELAEERTRRGGKERRYRAVRGTPLSDQQQGAPLLAETMAHTLRERAGRRLEGAEGVTVDAELWVDDRTWQDVRRRLADIAVELHEAARPPHTPGTAPLGLSLMAFPLRDTTAPAED